MIYDEPTFHYFLDTEQKRAEASNRPCVLLLVDFGVRGQGGAVIDPATGRKLMSILTRCLRETDFVGWYKAGRVAGAVLTEHGDADDTVAERVRQRIRRELERHFPRHLDLRLRVDTIPPATLRTGSCQAS